MTYELCSEEGDLKETVVELIKKIFADFDKDKDGVLNDKELDEFAIKLNGEPFDQDSREQIKEFFHIDDNGDLTQRGFIEMYEIQSSSEPEETIKDLLALGVDLSEFTIKSEDKKADA